MDPWTNLINGIIQFGGSALSGATSAGLGLLGNAADAAVQYHYAKKMYQHRYRWATEDMRKAGLNPVLATNGGNVSGMGSAPSTDMAGALTGGVSSALRSAEVFSSLRKNEQDMELSKAQADLANSKRMAQDIENQYLDPRARAVAERAMSEASIANSASVMREAEARWAEALAEGRANKSWYGGLKSRSDAKSAELRFKSSIPADQARNLDYWTRLARLHHLRNQDIYGGINSAAKILNVLVK